jgi:hypothetical protein
MAISIYESLTLLPCDLQRKLADALDAVLQVVIDDQGSSREERLHALGQWLQQQKETTPDDILTTPGRNPMIYA